MTEKINKTIKEYLSKIGAKGGKSGTGKSKVRGNSEYYAKIAKMKKKKEETN